MIHVSISILKSFCILAKPCNKKPTIDNGDITCRHESPTFGDMCAVVCKDGYRVKGFNLLGCDKTGIWGTLPVCEGLRSFNVYLRYVYMMIKMI